MDKFKRLNGTMKAVCIVAVALVLTGTLALLAAEKTERGFLGVSVLRLDGPEREKLGVTHGVLVATVEKESAAAKAGILEDDVIQSVNGEKLRDPKSLSEIVRELAPGSAAKIGLWRGGKALETTATLGKYGRPKRFTWKGAMLPKIIRSGAYLGVNLMVPEPDLAAYFSVKAGEGVLITGVEKDTPAAKAGLKAGDVIVQMADKPVKGSKDIHEALAVLKKGDSVAITVVRHGKKEVLKAEPDFQRHERVMRFFSGDKDIEIEHLELPELDIEIPEIDFEAPCPPDMPDTNEIVRKVHEKMDKVKIKINKHLEKIGENSCI
jgi:serine protease Do